MSKTKQQHHYFASNAFGWGTGETRAEAIAEATRRAGSDIIKQNVKVNGGLYTWSCRVETPKQLAYTIRNYAPDVYVDLETKLPTKRQVVYCQSIEHKVQNIKGHVIAAD